MMMGLSFFAVAFSGGCSSGSDVPVQTAEAEGGRAKTVEDQTSANDAASKSGGAMRKTRSRDATLSERADSLAVITIPPFSLFRFDCSTSE